MQEAKRNIHRPFHLELRDEIYFLTVKCYEGRNYLANKQRFVLDVLSNLVKELNIALYAWVVLLNHYHLLFEFKDDIDALTCVTPNNLLDDIDVLTCVTPNNLLETPIRSDGRKSVKKQRISYFVRRLNSSIARKINQLDNTPGRRIFYQYWDWCIRNEIDFYKHFNYIHQNLVKHGLVKNLEDTADYKYCSYNNWLEKKGEDFLFDCFYYYPISDFEVKEDQI